MSPTREPVPVYTEMLLILAALRKDQLEVGRLLGQLTDKECAYLDQGMALVRKTMQDERRLA